MKMQLERLWIHVEEVFRGMTIKHIFEKDMEAMLENNVANNRKWFQELPFLEVLQVMAPGMKIGAMLARDS